MAPLRIEVWSDVACPWCYVGKRRLEAALARLPSPGEVEVAWRSFELEPRAPAAAVNGDSYLERLARKYRTTIEQTRAALEQLASVGAAEGIAFRFERIRHASTFDAHRVLHLARDRGVQRAVKERLMRAYFTDGETVSDREALARLAGEAGLDPGDVRRMLAGDAYAAAVRGDEEEARELGIAVVPFFAIGEEHGIAGVQTVEVLQRAIVEALSQRPLSPAG